MTGNSLFNVPVQLIESFALREDVLSDAPRAPIFAIKIGFNLYQHHSLWLAGLYNIRR
jgi:hypothetical protein